MLTYRKIDTAGQVTAIITDKINVRNLSILAKGIMQKDQQVEQVGYIKNKNFRMMGGELSINGLLAAAYMLNKSGQINSLDFTVNIDTVTLTLPVSIVIQVQKNIVRLQGIIYKVTNSQPVSKIISQSTKQLLKTLAIGTKASGIIYYKNKTITPLVYVPDTNTYVWENACGSGSLAYSLITGNRKVIQPSGNFLKFKISKNTITVTATTKEI